MPHYVDGTQAEVGDVVRGRGYNLKDEDGNLRIIVAIVTGITRADTCNLSLLVPNGALGHFSTDRKDGAHMDAVTGHVITGESEYGQADHFKKVS